MAHDGETEGYYGQSVVAVAKLAAGVPFLKTDAFDGGIAAVSRLSAQRPASRERHILPQEDAIVLTLAVEPFKREMMIFDGRRTKTDTVARGLFSYCDLTDRVGLDLMSSCDALQFYMSKTCLSSTAREMNITSMDLQLQSGDVVEDPILAKMLATFCPAFSLPEQVNQLFIDHLTRAIAAHFAHVYGHPGQLSETKRGGLTPWQEKRVAELLEENLEGALPLQALADECALSMRHFSRAFNSSFGMPPYKWILTRRIERAKRLLLGVNLPLDEIASMSGFANQSHLTRVFKQVVGTSPGLWRRDAKGDVVQARTLRSH